MVFGIVSIFIIIGGCALCSAVVCWLDNITELIVRRMDADKAQ